MAKKRRRKAIRAASSGQRPAARRAANGGSGHSAPSSAGGGKQRTAPSSAATARGGSSINTHKKTAKRQKNTRATRLESAGLSPRHRRVALWLGAALVVGIVLPLVLFWPRGDDAASSSVPSAASLPVPSVALPPVAVPVPSAPASPPPVASQPSAPQSQPPAIAFTEEDTAALNALLDEWARQETQPLITKDEDGSQLEEPYRQPDGGHQVALWYLDVDSGAQYTYNAQQPFYYASMMKAPYAAYLYELAATGGCDLEHTVTITPEMLGKYSENTGVIKTMPLPAHFTVEQLIGYMLTDSDTVALKTLLGLYPAAGFVQWAAQQGVQAPQALNSVIYGQVTAQDAGALLCAVYRVMTQTAEGPRLRAHMEAAGNKMIVSQHPVAHKYGWDKAAYHDMAAVFAPHPYLLVILTDKWGGTWEEMNMFGRIAQTLEAAVAAKYQALGL